jgi:translation initiation factor IF-2
MEEQEIGVVDHFFDKISVGIVKLIGALKVGDTIHIKGKQTDFSQEIESMRIEFDNVTEAKEGDKVGIKVIQPLHANDKVYKVIA